MFLGKEKVSLLEKCPHFRGVLREGFQCIHFSSSSLSSTKLWDLRFATSPMRTLERHKKGILSLAWCPQDSDLLLTAAKDNLVLCWNPNSDIPGGEVGGLLAVSLLPQRMPLGFGGPKVKGSV